MACAFVVTGSQMDQVLEVLRLMQTLLTGVVDHRPEGFLTWTAAGLRLLVLRTGIHAEFNLLSSSEHKFVLGEPGGGLVALQSLLYFFQKVPCGAGAAAVVDITAAGGRLRMLGRWEGRTYSVTVPLLENPALPADRPPQAVRDIWGECPTRAWPALHKAQALQRAACWGAAAVYKASGGRLDANVLYTIKDAVLGARGAWPDWAPAEARAALGGA